jgi:hypothetical protein
MTGSKTSSCRPAGHIQWQGCSMITSFEKATQKLQRKIRKVGNNAFPDLLAVGTGGQAAAGD